jgi:hypothetical protein
MKKFAFFGIMLIIILLLVIFLWPKQTHADGVIYFYPGDSPHTLQISHDGGTLYAGSRHGILVIEKNTMSKVDTISFPHRCYDMKIDLFGQYMYCTYATNGSETGHVSRIRLSDNNIETIDLSPANVFDLTFDDAGDYAYVSGGTWPDYNEGFDMGDYIYNMNTGRIFEIRISDFTVTRTVNIGIDNKGISFQEGKLVVMSIEELGREDLISGRDSPATACHIIDVANLEILYTLAVSPGLYNTSYALPGDTYIMGGFNSVGWDGVGFGLINVNYGEVDHWYITEPDPIYGNNYQGGGFMMTIDEGNNILYSTLYCRQDHGQTHYRIGVIDLNTNEYSDWLVEPFRLYNDILFDPTSGNLYLPSPLDDAIVVLEPTG